MKSLQTVPRLAIIGLGDTGKKYVRACKKLEKKNILKVQASCDPLFIEYDQLTHYQQFNALIEQESFDVALLTVPVVYRYQMAIKLLSKGISVISPGPITASLKDLRKLQTVAKQKKLSVICSQIRFFQPQWIALKQAILNQKIKSFNFSLYAKLHPSAWQIKNAFEGIWFYEGWHIVQMMGWLGANIVGIDLSTISRFHSRDESALAKVQLQNGGKGIISVNSLQPKGDFIRVKTDKGLFSLVNNEVWKIKGQEMYEITLHNIDAYQQQLEHCLHLVAEQKSTFEMDKGTLQTIRNAQLVGSGLSDSKSNHSFSS